jgi:hypothetical protein
VRQADQDKAHDDADAQNREAIAMAHDQRLVLSEQHAEQIMLIIV